MRHLIERLLPWFSPEQQQQRDLRTAAAVRSVERLAGVTTEDTQGRVGAYDGYRLER